MPDLIAGASVQSYVFAWAATTAGLWFLFERAEDAMSARSRKQVVEWLTRYELEASIASIPSHFALLFDRVFGEKHFTLRLAVGARTLAVTMGGE